MRKPTRARRPRPRRKTRRKKPAREWVPLILRMPPAAVARLKAVAAVRKLPTARVLAVALRLYERHLQGVIRKHEG